MLANVWQSLGRVAIGGCAALLLLSGSAQAQDQSDLRARLEKLERDNAELKRIIQEGSLTQTQADGGAPKDQVEKIVKDYLDKKKKDDDTKKKADDEAKKKKDEEEGFEVGKDLTFKATFKDSLYFETADKAFKAQLRGRWHQDWGWAEADRPNPAPLLPVNSPLQPTIVDPTRDLDDGVIFRRARLGIGGTLWEVHDFVAEFEFASGTVAFRDVWMGFNQLPYVGTFRVGHFKEPFSLEQLTSSRFITFIERSIIDDPVGDNLSFNSGAILTNTYWDERGTWAIFAGRHTGDVGEDRGDGDYNYTGRVTVLPWYQNNGRCLLHLGAAASIRQPAGTFGPGRGAVQDTEVFRTRPYRVDPVAFLNSGALEMENYRVCGLEAAFVYGPLSIQAEYHRWNLDNVAYLDAGVKNYTDQEFSGYYAYASYFLTGEHRAYSKRNACFDRVRVHENAFLVETEEECCSKSNCCGKGAWEIAVRYAHLDLSDGRLGTAGEIGAIPTLGQLDQYTIGLNWYWNPNMRIMWNYDIFNLDRVGPSRLLAGQNDGTIQTFVMRFAWDF